MMKNDHQAGMAGGSLTGLLASISTADLLTTCLMAVTGTVVSYFVSMMLKRIFKEKASDQE